jgi:hypothetical protein
MKRSFPGWMLICILSPLTLTFSFGQAATTSLRGTIKDPSGALVPEAMIALVDKANGSSFSAVADSAGNYAFPQIPPPNTSSRLPRRASENSQRSPSCLWTNPLRSTLQ